MLNRTRSIKKTAQFPGDEIVTRIKQALEAIGVRGAHNLPTPIEAHANPLHQPFAVLLVGIPNPEIDGADGTVMCAFCGNPVSWVNLTDPIYDALDNHFAYLRQQLIDAMRQDQAASKAVN